jgi:hypothetical protein
MRFFSLSFQPREKLCLKRNLLIFKPQKQMPLDTCTTNFFEILTNYNVVELDLMRNVMLSSKKYTLRDLKFNRKPSDPKNGLFN